MTRSAANVEYVSSEGGLCGRWVAHVLYAASARDGAASASNPPKECVLDMRVTTTSHSSCWLPATSRRFTPSRVAQPGCVIGEARYGYRKGFGFSTVIILRVCLVEYFTIPAHSENEYLMTIPADELHTFLESHGRPLPPPRIRRAAAPRWRQPRRPCGATGGSGAAGGRPRRPPPPQWHVSGASVRGGGSSASPSPPPLGALFADERGPSRAVAPQAARRALDSPPPEASRGGRGEGALRPWGGGGELGGEWRWGG